jgi:alpha-1,3-rhamnosyl/mannosyltransferase
VAVSEHTKQDVVRTFGIAAKKVAVVPNGVEELYFSEDGVSGRPPNCPDEYFLFVGACVPRKNPLGVIRAYSQVHTRLKHKLVLVTSTGRYLNEVKRVVEDLGLSDSVIYYSALPQHQMLFLYRHAAALVFLSEYEGFGYPVAEAMAAGTPAIVFAGTSLSEVVGDAALTVLSDDIPAVSESMRMMALDEGLRSRYSKLGLHHSRQFNWRVAAEKMRAILKEVVTT